MVLFKEERNTMTNRDYGCLGYNKRLLIQYIKIRIILSVDCNLIVARTVRNYSQEPPWIAKRKPKEKPEDQNCFITGPTFTLDELHVKDRNNFLGTLREPTKKTCNNQQ